MDDDISTEASYISPLASPVLSGKALQRSLRLIKMGVTYDKAVRMLRKRATSTSSASLGKCLKRGVQEVTKALRKGYSGLVFIAADVHPPDIIAHIPVLCEEKDVVYAFIGNKRALGAACYSKRPTSVLLISPCVNDTKDLFDDNGNSVDFSEIYKKAYKIIRKSHPYF